MCVCCVCVVSVWGGGGGGETHHDPQGFEDVEFTHGAGTVLVQPRVHTHLVEDMPGTDTGREREGEGAKGGEERERESGERES